MLEFLNSLPPVVAAGIGGGIIAGVFKVVEIFMVRRKDAAAAGRDDAAAAKAISEAAANVLEAVRDQHARETAENERRYTALKSELAECRAQHAEKDRRMEEMRIEHDREIDELRAEIGQLREDVRLGGIFSKER